VKENEVIDKEVTAMLGDDVIEKGEGAWGFPVVMVRKKDGSVRFCIDYRAFNAVTVKDVYPLPRVDETLEALHGSRRYTSLDLHAGYWQHGVAPEDRLHYAPRALPVQAHALRAVQRAEHVPETHGLRTAMAHLGLLPSVPG
jgi:hypothetical protein